MELDADKIAMPERHGDFETVKRHHGSDNSSIFDRWCI